MRLAQGEQKRFSQAPRCGEIGPCAPPPRPPAAAQRGPRCFGAILRRHGAERGQMPAGNPEGKTRVSGDPGRPGACSGGIFLHHRRGSRGDRDLRPRFPNQTGSPSPSLIRTRGISSPTLGGGCLDPTLSKRAPVPRAARASISHGRGDLRNQRGAEQSGHSRLEGGPKPFFLRYFHSSGCTSGRPFAPSLISYSANQRLLGRSVLQGVSRETQT